MTKHYETLGWETGGGQSPDEQILERHIDEFYRNDGLSTEAARYMARTPNHKAVILAAMQEYAQSENTLLKEENQRLRAWKESAMSVTPPLQEIAKELDVKLGESIHDKILPGIMKLKQQIEYLSSLKQLKDGTT